jgi:hypothetical protein
MQSGRASNSGEFLVRKSVFLLTSAVGKSAAEAMILHAVGEANLSVQTLTPADIPRIAQLVEPALRPFVGDEQAHRLASALRVLVGGVVAE